MHYFCQLHRRDAEFACLHARSSIDVWDRNGFPVVLIRIFQDRGRRPLVHPNSKKIEHEQLLVIFEDRRSTEVSDPGGAGDRLLF
jgi:hypothetical protein